jgi:hypothetical protein
MICRNDDLTEYEVRLSEVHQPPHCEVTERTRHLGERHGCAGDWWSRLDQAILGL